MFVAPLVVPSRSVTHSRRLPAPRTPIASLPKTKRGARLTRVEGILLAWSLLGVFAYACAPSMRGSALLGATLPFWLIGAPLLDLAWLKRATLAGLFRGLLRARRRHVIQARKPRRLRSIRRRNSSMMRR